MGQPIAPALTVPAVITEYPQAGCGAALLVPGDKHRVLKPETAAHGLCQRERLVAPPLGRPLGQVGVPVGVGDLKVVGLHTVRRHRRLNGGSPSVAGAATASSLR